MQQYKGIKYFMPCMLKVRPPERLANHLRASETQVHFTLYSTWACPTWFFIQVVARMTRDKRYTLLLDLEEQVYCDSITFQYNEIDRVSISESFESVGIIIC